MWGQMRESGRNKIANLPKLPGRMSKNPESAREKGKTAFSSKWSWNTNTLNGSGNLIAPGLNTVYLYKLKKIGTNISLNREMELSLSSKRKN